ncbi:uncharacterized protein LOC103372394, partial [Stegastes partitus]|uniref:Uncharacterized protein LOC103372394 n=1 Tax=Stegastes partitus TaxID=144197 RepID=A0A9Y4U0J8_9TELE
SPKCPCSDAPKHTTILKGEEQQHPNGTRSVTLSCSAQSHPKVDRYSWYKNTYESKGYLPLPSSPTLTVFSHQKGEYYCTAENKIGKKSSESIRLFDDTLKKAVTYFLLICVILFISLFIFFLYRHRRNKSIQRGTIQPSCGFLGWRNSVERRNLMNEAALAEPFRSRDDLLPEQPCRPNAQRCQPRPDSTPPSNVNIVYATVNLPSGKQAPSAPKPRQQHEEDTQNDSLNYVSLHFGNKDKKPDETVVVYAQVSKNKASAEMERRADYENITAVNAANLPNLSDSDSDTSDDETEVNYSQVNFKPAPGHRRDSSSSSSDSSTSSEEDETQYSQVKV